MFVKGFGSIAPTDEKIAEIRFTELDPETKYEGYVIMSSEQTIEKRAVWSDFRVYQFETKPFGSRIFSLQVMMLLVSIFGLRYRFAA